MTDSERAKERLLPGCAHAKAMKAIAVSLGVYCPDMNWVALNAAVYSEIERLTRERDGWQQEAASVKADNARLREGLRELASRSQHPPGTVSFVPTGRDAHEGGCWQSASGVFQPWQQRVSPYGQPGYRRVESPPAETPIPAAESHERLTKPAEPGPLPGRPLPPQFVRRDMPDAVELAAEGHVGGNQVNMYFMSAEPSAETTIPYEARPMTETKKLARIDTARSIWKTVAIAALVGVAMLIAARYAGAQQHDLDPGLGVRIDRRVLIVDHAKQGNDAANIVNYWIAPADIDLVSIVLNPPNAKVTLKSGRVIELTAKADVQALADFMRWHELNWPSWQPNAERERYNAQVAAWETLQTNKWSIGPVVEPNGTIWKVYASDTGAELASDPDPIKAIDKALKTALTKAFFGIQ